MTENSDISRRNKRLLLFFDKLFPGRAFIGGKPDAPYVVIKGDGTNESVVLSCFVQNFFLHLVDGPDSGDKLFSIKLNHDSMNNPAVIDQIIQWYKTAKHRKVWRIGYPQHDLWLSGWNFQDKLAKTGKYPVFSRHDAHIFFQKEFADNIIVDYGHDHPEMQVI